MSGSKSSSSALREAPRGLVPRLCRSARLERETPSTSATRFTANLPSQARAAARSVFCLRLGERFPEDLVLHGLAAEQAFQFAHPLLKTPEFRTADHRFVRIHSCRTSLAQQPAPSVEKIGRHAVAPGDRRHRLARFETLLDDPQLCFRRPMPTPGDACDHLNALILLGHKPILKPVLEPFCLCRVAGRNGGQFRGTSQGLTPLK